jgi:hypothetical protein
MSHTKRAIEDINRLGWKLNDNSLKKLVKLRDKLKAEEKKKIKKNTNS